MTDLSDRVLPQHFRSDGTFKRKYSTLADALVAAHDQGDVAGQLVGYPCYCGSFHIGRPRPGIDYEIDDATITIHLLALGWTPIEVPHWQTGEPLARWERPQQDTHLEIREAWRQVTQVEERRARVVIGTRRVSLPYLHAGLTDGQVREAKLATLLRAGWKPPRLVGDPWDAPVAKRRKADARYTLGEAWNALLARQMCEHGQTLP